ncbi:MAG: bacteriohemerythrin [Gammaproteobacteria bacterium]|nr:bacteriohemerythrin [Gammaproteobacteria bacterium]
MSEVFQNRKSTLTLIIVLSLFLLVIDAFVYFHQQNYLHQRLQEHFEDQVALFFELGHKSFVNDDHTAIKNILDLWNSDEPEIFAVRVSAENGAVIAENANERPVDYSKAYRTKRQYDESTVIFFDLVADYSEINSEMLKLLIRLLGFSILLVGIMSYLLHRLAIIPIVSESKGRFASFVDNLPVVIYMKNLQGQYILSNKYLNQQLDLANSQVLGKTDKDIFKEDFAQKIMQDDKLVLAEKRAMEFEDYLLDETNDLIFYTTKFPIVSKHGDIEAIGGISVDITAYKKASEKLVKISRALKVLSEVDASMIHTCNERQWLNDVCQYLVDIGGYRFAWIGLAQEGNAKSILPVADAGYEDGYLSTLNLTWSDTVRGQGPAGTAVREKIACVISNTQIDPRFEPWRDDALKRGYNSVCSVPIVIGDSMGLLSLYSSEHDAFDSEEINLIEDIAEDIGFGILNFRTRAENKKTQDALSSEKQKFEQIVEGIDAGVILLNSELRIIWANTTFQSWFGSLDSIKGNHCYSVFGYADKTDNCSTCVAEKTQQVEKVVVAIKMPDGIEKYFELVTAPLFENDRIIQYVQMVLDVTERKVLENKRIEIEQRLNEAQHIAKLGSWQLDIKNNKFSWSDEVFNIFELDPKASEATYDTFFNVVHPDEREKVKKAYRESLLSKQPYEIVHRVLLGGGEIKFVHERCETSFDEQGEPLISIGTIQDITDQVQVEQALNESQDHYRRLIESTTAIPWEMDLKANRFIFVGPQAVKVLGYKVADWYQENFWQDHIHPDDKNETIKAFEAATQSGIDHEFEYRIISSDGRVVWVHDNVKVVKENDVPIRLQGFMFDVTDRRHAEEVLRRTQKMDAVGKLTGGIAHDFNNQLGVVQGYLDFLDAYTENSEKPHRWVMSASRATRRCIDLSKRLLNFSRQQQIEAEPVNINQALEKMHELIARSLTPRIEVKYDLDQKLWPVNINPGELEDVFLNLAINSRDAMPAGGCFSIRTKNHSLRDDEGLIISGMEPGDYIEIRITDTGTGIKQENLDRVFEPFFTTKEEGKGTGLGLSMVYSFVQRANGVIHMDSGAGEGTSFYIYLPRLLQDSDAVEVVSKDESVISVSGKGEIILVVDDEDELRNLAVVFLEMFGYKTLEAGNAAQAMNILTSDARVDLLFTDIIMPGGTNGYELAEKARGIRPDIKVLLTSGFTGDISQYQRSTDVLLNKPYSKQELLQHINDVLVFNDDAEKDEQVIDEQVKEQETAQTDVFEWDINLSTGHEVIDKDHQYLFKLLQDYSVALDNHTINQKAPEIFDELINYTDYHFAREEALMQACDYPHYENHRQVHKMLVTMVNDLVKVYRQDVDVFDHNSTVRFLKHWLTGHILGMDKAYVEYIQGNELQIEQAIAEVSGAENIDKPQTEKIKLAVVDDEISMGEFVCDVAESCDFNTVNYTHAADFIAHHDDEFNVIVLDLLMPDFDGIEMIRLLAGMDSGAALILISGVDESVLHSAQELAHEHGLNIAGTLQKPFHAHELKKLLEVVRAKVKKEKPVVVTSSSVENAEFEIADLQEALHLHQFIGYFQPQISIATHQVIGFEVLMRWNHPEQGLIPPFRFIPLAESSGLIDEMTWQLLEQVTREWQARQLEQTISVNMTAGMFKTLDLPEKLHAIGEKNGFTDSSRLMLEVTESALMEELTKSLDSLTRLRMKGFKLSIDDFGTGYSSMIQLYRAPFSELKVDQSFVMRMEKESEARAIVESTIDLGHNLNMKVVAEGVESASILHRLSELGCDIAQGYHIAKPMPIEAVPGWLEEWNGKYN